MKKSEKGFSVIDTLIVLIVVAFVGATGWMVYKNHHKAGLASTSNSTSASQAASLPPALPGTIQAVDNITTESTNSSSTIDSQYTNSDQSAALSSNGAASNLGGSYNESSF